LFLRYFSRKQLLQSDLSASDSVPDLIDIPELSNFDQLAPGDYIDCLNKNGQWMIASIDSFSDFRTEFKVVWPDGMLRLHPTFFLFSRILQYIFYHSFLYLQDTSEWLSMERDRHRMASFGTRSDLANPPPADTSSVNQDKSATTDKQSDRNAVLDVTDDSWKSGVEVGTLLDARDSSQVWYQVMGFVVCSSSCFQFHFIWNIF
jgi:hypothetical protein